MQTSNRLLDDLARVANGALSAAAGVREEIEQLIRQHFERYLADQDLVSREEFEAARAMAAKARAEQERLEAQIQALQTRIDALESAKPKPAASKRKSLQDEAGSAPSQNSRPKSSRQASDTET